MPVTHGIIASEKTRLRSVPVGAVKMRDGFWKRRMDRNHEHGIPRLREHLESHGLVDNFMIVSGRKSAERWGPYFADSDVFKWIEGASFDLMTYDDPDAKRELDRIIDEVVAAQGEDGYLNTFFQGDLFGQRFRNLAVEHELYCAGHLFQAAVAHYRATGEDKLLAAACRYADYLTREFGPGRREEVDGHPEIEMALVELYRTTGEKRYLDLAGFFLSLLRFTETPELAGHAVRALYACCGGADYGIETGDPAYAEAGERLWNDLVKRKMYVTGGVGSRYEREAIGEAYELPNARAYAETCAAIANVMWNYRLLAISGDARYADEMERALYNGVLAGVSLDGTSYFYMNPLACSKPYQRQEWFDCTCCPSNMVRALAALPGYMYSVSDEGVWVHLFDNSEVSYQLADGTPFTLEVSTNYPWDGDVDITVGLDAPKEFTIYVRKPANLLNAASTVAPGDEPHPSADESGYWAYKRTWQPGDKIWVRAKISPMLIECDPRVRENYGSVAVRRGPLVYCVESTDNPDISVIDVELASDKLECEFDESVLGGVAVIKGTGLTPVDPAADRGPLYHWRRSALPSRLERAPIKLIPYYAWANRGESQMAVWLPLRQDEPHHRDTRRLLREKTAYRGSDPATRVAKNLLRKSRKLR